MKWKGKPIEDYLTGGATRGGLSFSFRCLVCDLAFELRMSEDEFYERFDGSQRAQLVATYRSQMNRQTVMAIAPRE